MLSAVTCVFQKDRFPALAFFAAAVLLWISPSCSAVRSGMEQRLLAVAEAPAADLGRLEPKGRTNPDGSEVWGFPEGSGLEEVIEVHVKNGRVVREVLRPSSLFAADALSDS
jgi:hypothetical protein